MSEGPQTTVGAGPCPHLPQRLKSRTNGRLVVFRRRNAFVRDAVVRRKPDAYTKHRLRGLEELAEVVEGGIPELREAAPIDDQLPVEAAREPERSGEAGEIGTDARGVSCLSAGSPGIGARSYLYAYGYGASGARTRQRGWT